MSRLRVLVNGAFGRMGTVVSEAIERALDLEVAVRCGRGADLLQALKESRAQVAVDFTTPAAVEPALRTMIKARVPAVVGTTGLPPAARTRLARAAARARVGVVLAPNFALGAILLERAAREWTRYFPAAEVLELHHDRKRDAPSGTALRTAEGIAAARARPVKVPGGGPARGLSWHGVPIHSVRLPGLLAHQTVFFGGPGQVLSAHHDVTDRTAYVPGVLLAIRAVRALRGLVEGLDSLLPKAGFPPAGP